MKSNVTQPPGAASESGDPYLLTPGPLTTSLTVKQAMLHDYGSRDARFIDLNRRILKRLVEIVNGESTHAAVPLQGSGTFAVEAMIGCFVPKDGKLLICINGAYGRRIARICEYCGRQYLIQECDEKTPINVRALDAALRENPDITHVAVVYCETTSGILNPLKEISDTVFEHNRGLLIDAMSAFGALPLDSREIFFDALAASGNKCLEGVPGMGFCIAAKRALEKTAGNAPSLSLDLFDQWTAMRQNGQWRFTPPTHVILAFDQALREFEEEGGVSGRGKRYKENCEILVDGMKKLGFNPLLPAELQAPVIVTFHMPENPNFEFGSFYDSLRAQGYVIYPGKLTVAESFRIGCIGRLYPRHIKGALGAVRATLKQMGITGEIV